MTHDDFTRTRRSALRVAAATCALCFFGGLFLVAVALRTQIGMLVDDRAMRVLVGSTDAYTRMQDTMKVVTITTVLLGVIAATALLALRGRWVHAAAFATFAVGATLSTQALKWELLVRADGKLNSFPSGHSTAALVWALTIVAVVPFAWRRLAVVVGGVVAATIAVGTIAGHWHRPSDVAAASMVCLAWFVVAFLVASVLQPVPTARCTDLRDYLAPAAIAGALSLLAFFLLGFRPYGVGTSERIAGVGVLLVAEAVAVLTVAWAAWFADRTAG